MGSGVTPRGMSIQISFVYKGLRCRPTLKLEPSKANLKYAHNLRAEILRKIAVGTFTPQEYFPDYAKFKHLGIVKTVPLFRDHAETWLRGKEIAKSTRLSYRKILDHHILPKFGDYKLNEITQGMIAEWLGLNDWGSMKTRNNVMIPLRGIMELAYYDNIIDTEPTARIKNAKVQKKEPDPLTLDEVDAVLEYMRRFDMQVVNYFEFAFFAGLRTSELIALEWDDIDFKRELVVVQRAKVEREIKETKTASVRYVELNSRAMNALMRQKEHTFLGEGVVFKNPVTKRAYADDQYQRGKFWNPTLKALGMRQRDAYQTRHTFATLNLMAGANPSWLAKQMGHTTPKMIYDVYGRWLSLNDKGREKNKLESLINATYAPHEKSAKS